jgi:hypothetical protein
VETAVKKYEPFASLFCVADQSEHTAFLLAVHEQPKIGWFAIGDEGDRPERLFLETELHNGEVPQLAFGQCEVAKIVIESEVKHLQL